MGSNRWMTATLVAAAVSTTLIGGAPAATARAEVKAEATRSARACASKKEFGRIRHGMWRKRVTQIFGTPGNVEYTRHRNGHVMEVRDYPSCNDFGGAWIRFRDNKVYEMAGTF